MNQAPLTIQHSCRIAVPLEDCFAMHTGLRPDEYIYSDSLIAPITRVDMIQGKSFNEVGDIQKITFKGGATIVEEVLAFIPNRQFVYKGTGFRQPLLSWLDHAKGSFEYERDGDSTVVTWRYMFYLRPGLGVTAKRAVFNTVVVNFIWQRMMTGTLANLKQIITLRGLQMNSKP